MVIGAGAADGQMLVQHDLLGITEGRTPVFMKRYAALGDTMIEAVEAYAREGAFPGAEHVYPASAEVAAAVREFVEGRSH